MTCAAPPTTAEAAGIALRRALIALAERLAPQP